MRFNTIAKLLLVNDTGAVLFLRRSQTDTRRPGQWDLPGGLVEANEDPKMAAIRETKEEAGLQIADPTLIFGYSEPRPPHGLPTWLFYAKPVKKPGQVTLSFEHDAYKWMTPAMALNEVTYDLHRRLLEYVIKNKVLETLSQEVDL